MFTGALETVRLPLDALVHNILPNGFSSEIGHDGGAQKRAKFPVP